MISNHLSSGSGQCHLLQTLDVTSRSIFTAAQGSVFAEQAMFCIGEFNYYCWKDSNLVSSHRKTLDATWGQNWISQRTLPNNCLLFENCSIMYRCQRQQKTRQTSGREPTISITLILTVASFRPSIQSQNVMLDLAHGPWLSEAAELGTGTRPRSLKVLLSAGHKHGIRASQKNGELAQRIVLVQKSRLCKNHSIGDTSDLHPFCYTFLYLFHIQLTATLCLPCSVSPKIIKQKNLCINTNPDRPTSSTPPGSWWRSAVPHPANRWKPFESWMPFSITPITSNYLIPHACKWMMVKFSSTWTKQWRYQTADGRDGNLNAMTHRANTKKQASMPPCKPSNEQSPGSIFQQGDGRCNSWGVEENSLGCSWPIFHRQVSRSKSRFAFSHSTRNCLVTFWQESKKFSLSQHLKISNFQTSSSSIGHLWLVSWEKTWVAPNQWGPKMEKLLPIFHDRLQEMGNEIKLLAENGRPPERFQTITFEMLGCFFCVCWNQRYESRNSFTGVDCKTAVRKYGSWWHFGSVATSDISSGMSIRWKRSSFWAPSSPESANIRSSVDRAYLTSCISCIKSRVFGCDLEGSAYIFYFQKDL